MEQSEAEQDEQKMVRQHCTGETVSMRQSSISGNNYANGVQSKKDRKVRFADELEAADVEPSAYDAQKTIPAESSEREREACTSPPSHFHYQNYCQDSSVTPEQGFVGYTANEPHVHGLKFNDVHQGVPAGYYAYPYGYPYGCWVPHQYNSNHGNPVSSSPEAPSSHSETAFKDGKTQNHTSHTTFRDASTMQLKAKSVCITVNTAEENPQTPNIIKGTNIMASWPEKHVEGRIKQDTVLEETRMVGFGKRHLRRSCIQRVLNHWQRLCDQRWWKSQVLLRDQQNALLIGQINHMEHRPVRYLYRNRIRAWVRWWLAFSKRKVKRKHDIKVAQRHYKISLILHVWTSWFDFISATRNKALQINKAKKLFEYRRRRSAFNTWRLHVDTQYQKRGVLEGATRYRKRVLLRCVLGSWSYLAKVATIGKAVTLRHGRRLQISSFREWNSWAAFKRGIRTLVSAHRSKRDRSAKQHALYVWLAVVDAKRHYRLRVACSRLQTENQRLGLENDRLTKIVDSGELERKRIEELNLVGQALEQERSALMSMMGKSPSLALKSNRSNGKNKFQGGVSSTTKSTNPEDKCCVTQTKEVPGDSKHDFKIKNKIRVQAGSSFNALVRALKQDLIATGSFKRDPEAAYAVDKLSLSQVELTEEGGLRVAACKNTSNARGWTLPKSTKDSKFPITRPSENQVFARETTGSFNVGGRSASLPLKFSSTS